MRVAAYRVTTPIVAIALEPNGERLQELNPGTILILTSGVDFNGMIEATCGGTQVRVFDCDLEERSEEVEVRSEPLNS